MKILFMPKDDNIDFDINVECYLQDIIDYIFLTLDMKLSYSLQEFNDLKQAHMFIITTNNEFILEKSKIMLSHIISLQKPEACSIIESTMNFFASTPIAHSSKIMIMIFDKIFETLCEGNKTMMLQMDKRFNYSCILNMTSLM
jgi:hypothetical protein